MKLVSVLNTHGEERLGVLVREKIFCLDDLPSEIWTHRPLTMGEYLKNLADCEPAVLKAASWLESNTHPESKVLKRLASVPHPTSCRDGYAFRQHVETMRRNRGAEMVPEFDLFPVYYYTNHNAIVGEGVIDVQPDHMTQLDFELELAIVIGKKGRNIKAEEADDYIYGFTIMNDFSSRNIQMDEMKLSLGPAKGKDFATALGPYLVTKDELAAATHRTQHGNQYHLRMTARHNGKLISDGHSKDMHWTFAQILQRVSYGVDLWPGDVIGSGTVGTGCYAELNSTGARLAKESGRGFEATWLKDQDTIELAIEGLGTLTNRIHQVDAPYSLA